MEDDALRERLAELVVTALEVGSRKQDLADEIFAALGLDLEQLLAGRRTTTKQELERLRSEVAGRLADAAGSAAALVNVVMRSGDRFVDMVEDLYGLLARHAATTSGTSETFRLKREGVDEETFTISPAFIEQVRRLQRSIRRLELVRVDRGSLRDFLLWDNGELYGSFPPSALNRLQLADAVLHLAWMHELVGANAPALLRARAAAQRLVAAAEDVVAGYAAHLEVLGDLGDVEAVSQLVTGELDERDRGDIADEVSRFRRSGVLGGTAARDLVNGADTWAAARGPVTPGTWIVLGLDRDLTPVAFPDSQSWGGSGVGELAGFVVQARRGMWSERRRDQLTQSLVGIPVDGWLDQVTEACDQAARWLAEDLVVSAGRVDVERVVDVFEQFLNLPLWRQRDLLYEVWILGTTLTAAESGGWAVELLGLGADGQWLLPKEKAAEPVARLSRPDPPDVELDAWREPAREVGGEKRTPDVAIATRGQLARDLVVVEAKDRFGMRSEGGGGRGSRNESALAVGLRYATTLRPAVTWVCNHCEYAGAEVDAAANYGDAYTRLHLASGFRPKAVPDLFPESVVAALAPPHGATSVTDDSAVTVVIDMTGSMRAAVEDALAAFAALGPSWGSRRLRAVLFADHGAGEPYLVRKLGPFAAGELVGAVRAQPWGDGQDLDEALEDAMQRCNELVADVGAHTILVLTDAPPHPPFACPYGYDFEAEVEALLASGCHVAVATDWDSSDDPTWRPFDGRAGFRRNSLPSLLRELVPSGAHG